MNKYSTAVVLFAYNRPAHFEKTLTSALKELSGKNLTWYIYIDGPKHMDTNECSIKIAELAKSLLINETTKVTSRPINIGLKSSIILGVTEVFTLHEQAIILEDDLTLKKGAFNYFERCFDYYKNNKNIVQISGFSYEQSSDSLGYFLPITTSWGWATWRDRWQDFINSTLASDLSEYIKIINKNKFDFDNSYHFSKILNKEINNKVSSWAILFYLHSFINESYTIYPPRSFIINNGFDGSGTHGSSGVNDFFLAKEDNLHTVVELPKNNLISVENNNLEIVKLSLKGISPINRLKRLYRRK